MTILKSGRREIGSAAARSRVASGLAALDEFSFWTVPVDDRTSGDLIVVGSTGAFVVAACDLAGPVSTAWGTPTVGGYTIPGLRGMRGAARRVRSTLGTASVFTDVEPMICLTEAIMGPPMTVKGVRILHVRDLARDLSARPRALEQGRAQRGARALGMKLAGDHKRHFTTG